MVKTGEQLIEANLALKDVNSNLEFFIPDLKKEKERDPFDRLTRVLIRPDESDSSIESLVNRVKELARVRKGVEIKGLGIERSSQSLYIRLNKQPGTNPWIHRQKPELTFKKTEKWPENFPNSLKQLKKKFIPTLEILQDDSDDFSFSKKKPQNLTLKTNKQSESNRLHPLIYGLLSLPLKMSMLEKLAFDEKRHDVLEVLWSSKAVFESYESSYKDLEWENSSQKNFHSIESIQAKDENKRQAVWDMEFGEIRKALKKNDTMYK